MIIVEIKMENHSNEWNHKVDASRLSIVEQYGCLT